MGSGNHLLNNAVCLPYTLEQMTRLLVIEDNARLNQLLVKGLAEAGYSVSGAHTLRQGLARWDQAPPALVLLDAGLPDGDGIDALAERRKTDPQTLVILLTARDSEEDRLKGFDGGADDYMGKPFSFPELLARIKRHLQRVGESPRDRQSAWQLNPHKLTLGYQGEKTELTPREMRIMALLLDAQGELVSREDIFQEVWPESLRSSGLQNTLEVHLSHLREKVKSLCGAKVIETVRSKGYRLKELP